LSITCEERREEGRSGAEEGVSGFEGGWRDEWTNGLTFGTPAYHHGLPRVVHVGATTAGSIPSEQATLKGHGAAATAVNINCPSPEGSSIVDECDEDKDDVGVVHFQPSTITTSISIFYDEV